MNTQKRKAPSATNIQGRYTYKNSLKPDYNVKTGKKSPDYGEILLRFQQAVVETIGYAPERIQPDGKLHRFSSSGRPGDTSGWYVLFMHPTGAAGMLGCWRSGTKQVWGSSSGDRNLREQEWQQIRAAIAQGQQKAAAERAAKANQAQQQALKMWLSAQTASPNHPYLIRKGVGAPGIRQVGHLLLIPVCDLDGTLQGLQTIDSTGRKHFLTGTPKRGHFCLIGDDLYTTNGVYLCEGYATGVSLYEAYQQPVLVAFDAGNLLAVAQTYHARFPNNPLTVCADNDRETPGNPGLTKARAVCAAFPNMGLIVPDFPDSAPTCLSDFNDLMTFLRSSTALEVLV